MKAVNLSQALFYEGIQAAEFNKCGVDGYAGNQQSGVLTRVWAAWRAHRKNLLKQQGWRDVVEARVRRWLRNHVDGEVLEIGCFNGTRNSLWLMEHCSHYTGIDLSPSAINSLRGKALNAGLGGKVTLVAGDVLDFDPPQRFDLIYSQGVLHHFKHPEVLFALLARLMKPGGCLVFSDPAELNGVLRLARRFYRPFQSDQAWEWPFTRRTVDAMSRHFELREAFGYGRFSTLLVPFIALPGLGLLLSGAYQRLLRAELGSNDDQLATVWKNAVVHGLAVAKETADLATAAP
ncbi:class I SAM-dependent methyltransferase [Zoogloea sp.]|uniref:class I SAM-dependent methyltransferase n=1 Tax=Zoogloea sp. TaxID=49181 RepID=UPI00321FE2DB